MGSSKIIKEALKNKRVWMFTGILVVFILILVASTLGTKEEDTEYKEWEKVYNTLPEQVDYDKYTKIAECMADIAIGVNVSDDNVEMLRKELPDESFKNIEVTLNNERIGDIGQTEKTVEEQMDAMLGGKTDDSDSKYRMSVLSSNYYHPDVYVYKLVNKNNSCVIITIYTNGTGGIENVKTSL